MNELELTEKVKKIKWWHTINLGMGVVTPGLDNSPEKLKTLRMPENLAGMSVLDIGAWDGFFSFEAEHRGAKRVLATDHFCWGGPGWGTKAGFDLAKVALDSKVEDKEIDVLEITPQKIGTFDLVLFLGVLYHMRHPLLALEKVSNVTTNQLILETAISMQSIKEPVMRFIPGDESNNDPTNWWLPNCAVVQAMLKDVGFKRVEIVSRWSFSYRLTKAIYLRTCKRRIERRSFFEIIQDDRVVFHAFK